MTDVTATNEIADDARVRANVVRLAAAQALTGANSAVIFATGSIVGATLAPDVSFATVPISMYVLGLAAGIPCLFWAAYQYLLVVYSASTPGLRLAGLELARFDGTSTTRSLRRWRVLAGWLSAVSLGMGYAWVFLDEDALCWHDRITHTYMAPKKRRTDDAT